MPFGPTNAPIFYTAMMKNFKDKWDNLFAISMLALGSFENAASNMYVAQTLILSGKN